jgi:hypothetical protein
MVASILHPENDVPMSILDDEAGDAGIPARRADAPMGLFFSRSGAWYHDGDRIRHAGIIGLLGRSVARDDGSRLVVTTGRDVVTFVAEDAPLLVSTMARGALVLSDGSTEACAGRTFLIDDEGRIRCPVKDGRFWALLSRSATQLLCELLDDAGVIQAPDGACALTPTPARDWTAEPRSPPGA